MKRILMLLFATILLTQYLDAQTTEDSVKAVIKQLFEGMKNSDPKMIQNAFADSAILQSVGTNKEGKIVIENERIDEFAKFISGLKKGAADEQIVFESIKIDGQLAMAGLPINFTLTGNSVIAESIPFNWYLSTVNGKFNT